MNHNEKIEYFERFLRTIDTSQDFFEMDDIKKMSYLLLKILHVIACAKSWDWISDGKSGLEIEIYNAEKKIGISTRDISINETDKFTSEYTEFFRKRYEANTR